MQKLLAREIERIENTSIAAALTGPTVAVSTNDPDCTGICVGVICYTAICDYLGHYTIVLPGT